MHERQKIPEGKMRIKNETKIVSGDSRRNRAIITENKCRIADFTLTETMARENAVFAPVQMFKVIHLAMVRSAARRQEMFSVKLPGCI